MTVLVVYLVVSMAIQMAEGSTWFFCLLHLLSLSFLFFFLSQSATLGDVQQPAIQSEMPLRL